jgi:hypothetical protein
MKQETLEEAAERIYGTDMDSYRGSIVRDQNIDLKRGFVKGAKWQMERMYSEEEVLELLQKALTHQDDGETGSLVTVQGQIRTANFYSWFAQFKKPPTITQDDIDKELAKYL